MLVIYLSIPKPHLASQFATLLIRSSTASAQFQSDVKKQKEGSTLEDMRQESTIGTALETEASGSGVSGSDVSEIRRTTSSAVSIEPKTSGLPF